MNSHVRKSIPAFAIAALLASSAALAADTYTLTGSHFDFTPEDAVARISQELVEACENRGDVAGAVTVNSITRDPYVYFAEATIVCHRN
ncbi:hypothetical protein ABIE09_002964 [Lysobacter enzymogenes]|uniref:hypothetical protein n=1 Tax=Lysobacter enzymogenes TaxID=69 RepID=UPI003392656A